MGTLTRVGLLLLGLGLAGLALSLYEITSTTTVEVVRTEVVVRTESYIEYETHTKTIYEQEEITKKVTKTEPVLSGSVHLWPDPGERPVPKTENPFQAGLLFVVKSRCNLKINSNNPITRVRILTPYHWVRAQENPECYVISPFYEWNDVKVLNTDFDLPPGEYVLNIYTWNKELTVDYSIDCTFTETVTEKIEKPKEVTESVPVEKTREITDTREVVELQKKDVTHRPYQYLVYPSLASFFGGVGFALYGNFIVPMQLAGGGDDAPPRGRNPSKKEKDFLEKYNPGLKNHKYAITDEMAPSYNCIGWSLCSRLFGWISTPVYLWFASKEDQVNWYDRLYSRFGWERTENCSPEKGYRKIVLYRREKEQRVNGRNMRRGYFHTTKQVKNNWWESKFGMAYRIIHPGTGCLEGKLYGKIVRCYKKDLKTLLKDAKDLLKKVQDKKNRLNAITPRNNAHKVYLDRVKVFLVKAEKEAEVQIRDYEKAIKEEGGR